MEKGTYGYGKKKLRVQLLKLAACSALVITGVVIGLVITGTRLNIFTIGALFSVIPTATFAVNVIVRLKGLPMKEEKYARFEAAAGDNLTACDMILTAGQKNVPVQAAVIHETGMAAYSEQVKDADRRVVEMDLNKLSKDADLRLKVQLFTDYEQFLKRIREIRPAADEDELVELAEKKRKLLLYSM